MQTVGENVKKIYSNVVHDILPPLGDSKEAKAEAVSKTQHDAGGSHIRSMVGIKDKHRHSNERESSKEQDIVDLRSCDTTEGDYPVQFSPPHYSDSPQVAETGLHWKEDSDADIYNNREMVLEENVVGENYPAARYLSSPREENSSELASYWREQQLLTVNLEHPEDGNLGGPSEISNNGDQSNIILADFCQRDLVEDGGLGTFLKNKTTCNSADLSEEAEAALSLKQDGENAFEENAAVKEHPASEHTSSFDGKDSCKLLCTKEPRPVADDLCPLKDKSLPMRSSTDEDNKTAVLMKHSQEIWVPDTVLRVVPGEQAAVPCDEAVTNLSLEHDLCVGLLKHGVGHEANVRKDHLVVDSRSSPNYKSSSDLSSCSRERHLVVEDSSALEDKILDKSSLISTNEEHRLMTLDKFLSQTLANDEELGVFQEEEGVCNRPSCSNETETNFSLDGYSSCVSLDFSVEENDLVEKHAVTEHLDCPEIISSYDLSLYSRKLHVESDGLSSPKAENSSKSSLSSRSEDTIPAKLSPDASVHDAGVGAFHKDETACDNVSEVLSASLSSEPASCISWDHNLAETDASISAVSTEPLNMLEFSLANATQKTEKVCCDYTDSAVCVSALSSISSASFSCLASGKKAVNLIPAFPRTASSAGGYFKLFMSGIMRIFLPFTFFTSFVFLLLLFFSFSRN